MNYETRNEDSLLKHWIPTGNAYAFLGLGGRQAIDRYVKYKTFPLRRMKNPHRRNEYLYNLADLRRLKTQIQARRAKKLGY